MQFSDTTNKQGLIQECEFLTNLGDAAITGDSTLLKQFTNRINRAYDEVLPLVLANGDKVRFDDVNQTDQPWGLADISSGYNSYQFLTDGSGNSILNITDVMILPAATSTEYIYLRRMTIDEPRALRALSPNPTDIGVPSAYLEKDNTVFFNYTPNYSATGGIKVFFERNPSYFASNDTIKTPGIPSPFHPLLAKIASRDWLLVNKPDQTVLIAQLNGRIAQDKLDLQRFTQLRNPKRGRVLGRMTNSI